MLRLNEKLAVFWICSLVVLSVVYYFRGRTINEQSMDMNVDTTKCIIEDRNNATMEAIISEETLRVYVNEQVIYVSSGNSVGVSMVFMDPSSLEILGTKQFNDFKNNNDALLHAISSAKENTLIALGVVVDSEESTLNILPENFILELLRQGSIKIKNLKFKSLWSMIFIKDRYVLTEEISHRQENGQNLIQLNTSIFHANYKMSLEEFNCTNWPKNGAFNRRITFCIKYYREFPNICDCHKHAPIDFQYKPLNNHWTVSYINSVLEKTPVVIMASSRPKYLMKCLQRLLSISGTRINMITIYVDTENELNIAISKLFGIKLHYTPKRCPTPCAIGHHYKAMFSDITQKQPEAPEIIVIEEDLLVSRDFFSYFAQVLPSYRKNEQYYCVSAWNDQSYNHTTGDYGMLYPVDFMPGLGFAMRYTTVVNDWLPVWPKRKFYHWNWFITKTRWYHWDWFVRYNRVRHGRECIVPDISRTFHIGEIGNIVDTSFQNEHFNTRPAVLLEQTNFDTSWLENNSYESLITDLISQAQPFKSNSLNDICAIGIKAYNEHMNVSLVHIPPEHQPRNGINMDDLLRNTQIVWLEMGDTFNETSWRTVSKCLKIWTNEARDFHSGALRIWFSGTHYIIVTCPLSKYCEYKPAEITPIPLI